MQETSLANASTECLGVFSSPVGADSLAAIQFFVSSLEDAFTAVGLTCPSTENIKQLIHDGVLISYVDQWFGDGEASTTRISVRGTDLREGLWDFMKELATLLGAANGVKERKARDRDFFWISVDFGVAPADDPLNIFLEIIECRKKGHKWCSPQLILNLMPLPLVCRSSFLAGGISTDGTLLQNAGGYRFKQALMAHQGTVNSKYYSHASIIEAFNAIATTLAASRGVHWEMSYGHGIEYVDLGGISTRLDDDTSIRGALMKILPRKVPSLDPSDNEGKKKNFPQVAGIRSVGVGSVSENFCGDKVLIVLPIGEDGVPLDVVDGTFRWITHAPTDRSSEILMDQCGWGHMVRDAIVKLTDKPSWADVMEIDKASVEGGRRAGTCCSRR